MKYFLYAAGVVNETSNNGACFRNNIFFNIYVFTLFFQYYFINSFYVILEVCKDLRFCVSFLLNNYILLMLALICIYLQRYLRDPYHIKFCNILYLKYGTEIYSTVAGPVYYTSSISEILHIIMEPSLAMISHIAKTFLISNIV